MPLIIDSTKRVFDVSLLKKGYLLFAKHKTWPEGKGGFVTAVTEKEVTVQYHPGIGNVTNHFFLPAGEVASGEWEVRWSEDLAEVHQYVEEASGDDPGRTDS